MQEGILSRRGTDEQLQYDAQFLPEYQWQVLSNKLRVANLYSSSKSVETDPLNVYNVGRNFKLITNKIHNFFLSAVLLRQCC